MKIFIVILVAAAVVCSVSAEKVAEEESVDSVNAVAPADSAHVEILKRSKRYSDGFSSNSFEDERVWSSEFAGIDYNAFSSESAELLSSKGRGSRRYRGSRRGRGSQRGGRARGRASFPSKPSGRAVPNKLNKPATKPKGRYYGAYGVPAYGVPAYGGYGVPGYGYDGGFANNGGLVGGILGILG